MIIKYIWPVIIVSLPTAEINNIITFSKLDYTSRFAECQEDKEKNTLEYNYIKAKDLIENNNQKYQDLIR